MQQLKLTEIKSIGTAVDTNSCWKVTNV